MLNNSHSAESGYVYINLDSDGSLGFSAECGDLKMLFNPFEKKLYLPSVLVEKHNLYSRQEEIFGIKYKASLTVRDVCVDTSYPGGIIGCIPIPKNLMV